MLQTLEILEKFYNRSKSSLRDLPSFVHLIVFLIVLLAGVLTLNFEVFRVIRFGDLMLLFFSLVISIHWYGQKMQEAGYNDAIKEKAYMMKLRKDETV